MTLDFSDRYWLVKQQPETVLHINGGRLFFDHYLRVVKARIAAEQMVPVLLLPVSGTVRDKREAAG